MKTIVSDREEILSRAAARFARVLREKPDAVLLLAAGRTMAGLFDLLAAQVERGELSLSRARIFAAAELEGAPEALSCRRAIESGLLERTDARRENCFFLSPEALDTYDMMISCAGGADLAVLGLGDNGHIGYNEPATAYDSLSHRQKLTPATRRQLAPAFGGEEKVPEYGLTVGIRTIVEAREILLVALGREKAEAVFRTVYGKSESYTPASFLQLPLEVSLYLDREAAEKL